MKIFEKHFKPAAQELLLLVLALAMLLAPIPGTAQITSTRDAAAAFIKETTFLTSAARTASGNSGAPVDISAYDSAVILINVTAVSGTSPTLTVNFENCMDSGTTKCGTHTASASITATGFYVIKAANTGRYVRTSHTIGGTTPSFTFEVYGAFKPSS